MLVANYIILFVILISLGILYQKYLEKQSKKATFDEYESIIMVFYSYLKFYPLISIF